MPDKRLERTRKAYRDENALGWSSMAVPLDTPIELAPEFQHMFPPGTTHIVLKEPGRKVVA